MVIRIGAEIRIQGAPKELYQWCSENLIIRNPEFDKKRRMGLWTGNMPEYLWLYRMEGDELVTPTGVGKEIRKFVAADDQIQTDLAPEAKLQYGGEVPLYDYQELAVKEMKKKNCGIIQAPCGSGKTQIGIALAARLGSKALWITHTHDLLTQSYERAAQYFPREVLGKIAAGRVQIGSHMTFATVQTLCNTDLMKYQYTWDTVIVDECHRLAGSPTQMTMFYKVMNNLAARHKYGLSATVHRSDGLIRSTFAVLGPVAYQVPDEAVAEKTMKVRILPRETGVKATLACMDTDGTIDYQKLISYLVDSQKRNDMIVQDLVKNQDHHNLILSDRLEHLHRLMSALPEELREQAVMIDGSMTSKKAKAARVLALEDMRAGRKRYLFASFGLAKEGLDIPRLDRLYMALPKKDYAVVTQSIGRIARTAEGKAEPVCYDYVDNIQFCMNQYKRRRAHYRKAGCIL